MRSHRSRNSGAGGLCAVRMAFTPSRFSASSRRSQAPSGTATPNAPASWCRHTPLSFRFLPLSQKPVAASKRASRMPNGIVSSSTVAPHLDQSAVESRVVNVPERRLPHDDVLREDSRFAGRDVPVRRPTALCTLLRRAEHRVTRPPLRVEHPTGSPPWSRHAPWLPPA